MKAVKNSNRKRLHNGEIRGSDDSSQSNFFISLRTDLISTNKATGFPTEITVYKQSNNSHNWMKFDTTKYFPVGISDESGKKLDIECDVTATISFSTHLNKTKSKEYQYDNCMVTDYYKTAKLAGSRIPKHLREKNPTPVYWFASMHVYIVGVAKILFSCGGRPDITPLEVVINVIDNSQSIIKIKEPKNIIDNVITTCQENHIKSQSINVKCNPIKMEDDIMMKLYQKNKEELHSLTDLVFNRSLIAAIQKDKDKAFIGETIQTGYQPTVKEIVEAAITHHLSLGTDNTTDNIITNSDNNKPISPELGSRLLILFDTLLEHRLLYVEELEYFHSHNLFSQLKSGGIRPSSWFGATHLLRLVLYIMNGPKVVTIPSSSTANDNNDSNDNGNRNSSSQKPTRTSSLHHPSALVAFLDFDINLLGDLQEVKSLLESCLRQIPLIIS